MISKNLKATPAKLRNGSWGARVRSERVRAGDAITITAKSGKSWTTTVSKVVWSGDGVSLCATVSRGIAVHPVDSACHTDGNCSSMCSPRTCPCGDGSWFRCC